MTTPSNSTPDSAPDSWERVAGELRACKESQKQAWGDLDSSTLGRYLAGEVADRDELGLIERELADHPELRQLTDLVRDVLGELEPLVESLRPASDPAPTVLSFEKARKKRRVLPFLRQHAALVAAACLLIALGSIVPGGGVLPSTETNRESAFAMPAPFLETGVALASATSPTTVFTTVESPTPTEIASDAPLPELNIPPLHRLSLGSSNGNSASGTGSTQFAMAHRTNRNLAYFGVTEAKKISSSDAADNHRRGQDYLRRGQVSRAEQSLVMTYAHCQQRLGSHHPYTTQTAQDLANLYAPALNEGLSKRSFPVPAPPVVVAVPPAPFGKADATDHLEVARLREQIANQTLPQIQATVVPALIRALETAPTPDQRQSMVLALGNLGPAASPALPALQRSLNNATPAETRTVLFTMGLIGPASVPVLNQLANTNADRNAGKNDRQANPKDRANLSARDQQLIRVTLRKLQSPEAQAGIADEAACLSFREIRTASMQLHRLAKTKDFGILVLIQTRPAKRPDDATPLARLGQRGVHVVLDLTGNVDVKVSKALETAGFSASAVRDGMLDLCKEKQYDKACNAGIARILEQAEKLKRLGDKVSR